MPAQPLTAHRIVHVVRKPRAGPAKVPFYQLCALNGAEVNVTKDAAAKTQARQGPGVPLCARAPGVMTNFCIVIISLWSAVMFTVCSAAPRLFTHLLRSRGVNAEIQVALRQQLT